MLWIRFGMDLHSRLIFFIVSWNFLLALFQHSSASSVGPVGAKPNFGPVGGRSYGQQQQHHPSHSESAPLSAPNTPYLSQAASLTYQTAAHNYLYGGEASLGGVESPYGPCWGETVPPGGSSWPQGLSWKDKLLLGPLLGSCFCGLSLCQLYCIYGPKSTYRYYVCSSIRILPDLMQELPCWQRVGDCHKWKRRNIIIVFKKSNDRNYRFRQILLFPMATWKNVLLRTPETFFLLWRFFHDLDQIYNFWKKPDLVHILFFLVPNRLNPQHWP